MYSIMLHIHINEYIYEKYSRLAIQILNIHFHLLKSIKNTSSNLQKRLKYKHFILA